VAENNDLEQKELADTLRKRSHRLPSNHLFLSKCFWNRFPNAQVKNHFDIGFKYLTVPYRYSVLLRVK
jgi:hypothetical protein